MGSKTAKSYSPEFREQIIKECMETNKYNVVAKNRAADLNVGVDILFKAKIWKKLI